MLENTTGKNSVFGHFSSSDRSPLITLVKIFGIGNIPDDVEK